jgi:hypothetical protein
VLAASLLLVTLAQGAAPELFLWRIGGLADRSATMVVTVTPTPFGLASGIDIKDISLQPTRTRIDSRPRSIRPHKTEITTEWALQAWFTRPERRFTLTVTLSDGKTHRIDPWAPVPPKERTGPTTVRPLVGLAVAVRAVWHARHPRDIE